MDYCSVRRSPPAFGDFEMIDTRPFIFILLFPLAALIAVGVKAFYPDSLFKKAYGLSLLVCIALYAFIFYGPFVDVRKHKSFEMSWEIGEPAKEWPKETHVIMHFVKYPAHHQGYYSGELAEYLRKSGKKTVMVEFETASDYGKMRGYHETRIGDFHFTRAPAFAYGGTQGEKKTASPWDEN